MCTSGKYRCDIHGFETDSRGQMQQHIDYEHPGGAAKDHPDEFLTHKIELAWRFNEKHGCTLHQQALKMGEEFGEVNEAVLGLTGDLLFMEPTTADEVGDELADLIATADYVAELADVEDIDERVLRRLQANLARNDRARSTGGDRDVGGDDSG